MSGLNLNGITKIYPSGATALYDVSLEAGDREFLVILGGEKCGKSSLLKVIAGVEDASSGSIFIDGKDLTGVEPKDRDVAMVYRGDTLYPSLNVYDNMAFGLRLRKAPQALIDKRVKSAADILGLNEILYRKPKVLSAAARQRVAIARAIVREPRLYLFDEPLAGIDETLRRDMLNVIINLQARMNGTFIYATKNLSEALTIGTRIAVMKSGLIQQIDTPSNLYDYPANTYVAFLIGSPTVNLLKDVKIVKGEDGYAAESGFGRLKLPENIVKRFSDIEEYAQSGKAVILGLRPEDVKCAAEGPLSAKMGKTEEADGVTYAECTLSDGQIVLVTADAHKGKTETVSLAVDGTRLYLFDAETRLTLLSKDGGYKPTGHKDADRIPLPYPEEQRIIEKLKPQKQNLPKKKIR